MHKHTYIINWVRCCCCQTQHTTDRNTQQNKNAQRNAISDSYAVWHVCLEWKLTYNWFSTRALLTEVRSHCACAAAAAATAIADCLSPHTNEDSASQSPSPSPSSLSWLGYLCVRHRLKHRLRLRLRLRLVWSCGRVVVAGAFRSVRLFVIVVALLPTWNTSKLRNRRQSFTQETEGCSNSCVNIANKHK